MPNSIFLNQIHVQLNHKWVKQDIRSNIIKFSYVLNLITGRFGKLLDSILLSLVV